MPLVDDGGAVDLGQSVDVGDIEAGPGHGGQHGLRRRSGGGDELDPVGEGALLLRAGVEQRRHDDGGAAQVGHLVLGDGIEDGLRAHPAQAHVRAGHGGEGPGEAPAVAVEHRQGPQIDGVLAEAGRQHVGVAHEGGAAVVIDHALGVAGGARGVVEGDRLPLVVRQAPAKSGSPSASEGFVADVGYRIVGLGNSRSS